MQLDIPGDLFNRLSIRTAPGATEIDALREVLDVVEWLETDQPNAEQLAASLAQIDRSMNDVAEGRTLSVAEARQKSLKHLRSGTNEGATRSNCYDLVRMRFGDAHEN